MVMVLVLVMVMLMVRMESRVSAERILTGEHDYGGRITGCVRSHQRSATPHSCSPSSSRATTFQSAAQLATRKFRISSTTTGDLSAVGLGGGRSLFLAADTAGPGCAIMLQVSPASDFPFIHSLFRESEENSVCPRLIWMMLYFLVT